MHVVCSGHFWQFGSIASLATETTDGEILVAFFGPNMAPEVISGCLILKYFRGEHAPRPPSLFTLKHMQWQYQSKIVGARPDDIALFVTAHSAHPRKCSTVTRPFLI